MTNTEQTILERTKEFSEAGFEKGSRHTGGELTLHTQIPDWASEPTDFQSPALNSNNANDNTHHGHEHKAPKPASAVELLESEKKDGDGYVDIVVKFSEILNTPGLLGRVLLYADPNNPELGYLPLVIMPDASNPGRSIKLVKFDEPYNPETGIDEGKLLALSFETMAKEQAGFGVHGRGDFEGGHFTVAALASVNPKTSQFMEQKRHSGTHKIIAGSVATDLSLNNLLTADVPMPSVKIIDVTKYPKNAAIKLRWREDMVDNNGVPLRAVHPDATRLLVGNMIHRLGNRGLDRVSGFVTLASED